MAALICKVGLPKGYTQGLITAGKVYEVRETPCFYFGVNDKGGELKVSKKRMCHLNSDKGLFEVVESDVDLWEPVDDHDAWKAQDDAVIKANRK